MDGAGQLDLNDLSPRAVVEDPAERQRLRAERAEHEAFAEVARACRRALVIPDLPEHDAIRIRRLLIPAARLAGEPPEHLRLDQTDLQRTG